MFPSLRTPVRSTSIGVVFSVWIVLDFFFDWHRMWEDIVKRPYITMGMLGLLSLIPLAATSTAGMIKRLGARRWRRLHRLPYLAGGGGWAYFPWPGEGWWAGPEWEQAPPPPP